MFLLFIFFCGGKGGVAPHLQRPDSPLRRLISQGLDKLELLLTRAQLCWYMTGKLYRVPTHSYISKFHIYPQIYRVLGECFRADSVFMGSLLVVDLWSCVGLALCVQRMLWRRYFCPCGCLRIAASSMLEMSNDFTQSLHLTFFSQLESRASQALLLGLVNQPFSPHSYTKLDDAPMPNSKRKYTNRCYLYLPYLITVSMETTMITHTSYLCRSERHTSCFAFNDMRNALAHALWQWETFWLYDQFIFIFHSLLSFPCFFIRRQRFGQNV